MKEKGVRKSITIGRGEYMRRERETERKRSEIERQGERGGGREKENYSERDITQKRDNSRVRERDTHTPTKRAPNDRVGKVVFTRSISHRLFTLATKPT